MTEDTFPPPDDEELEAAHALRQALEGRPGGPRVPEEALQTAAFLRHAGDGGGLSSDRRAQLRADLLAALPPPLGGSRLPASPASPPRKGWRQLFDKRWLGMGVTLIGAASAAITVGVLGVREWSTHDRASEARLRAMETTAHSDESSAPEAATAEATDLTSVPPPSELAAPAQGTAEEEEADVVHRAIGGLAQPQLEAPGARSERRRSAAMRPAGSVASGGAIGATSGGAVGAASGGAAPSKPARRSPAFAAAANEAAPTDEDGTRGRVASSDLRTAERKGGGAAAPVPAAPATAATAGPNAAGAADARIARQRQERRNRLLTQLGDTRVQSAYQAADRARSVPELEQARERLTALSSAGLGGSSTTLEAEQLRPDVYCRLAELTLRLGQARAALDWTRQGLELGTEPSPFVACLYQQQGRAKEALGDRDGAARSYMSALKVNEQLLDESLEGP